ncbi:MAG TPA: hypothetical protein VJ603_08950 [Paucimonas sp.]|nr:hypothetical protein [Paucimonas sp.]HJW54243.1 hypothetical protein [Burkholderiaceae bacterium]
MTRRSGTGPDAADRPFRLRHDGNEQGAGGSCKKEERRPDYFPLLYNVCLHEQLIGMVAARNAPEPTLVPPHAPDADMVHHDKRIG